MRPVLVDEVFAEAREAADVHEGHAGLEALELWRSQGLTRRRMASSQGSHARTAKSKTKTGPRSTGTSASGPR
jgi:hypothetical protein